ncbi:MAG: CotH kinase family protein, partial [Bacteroidota bacterium]
MKNCLVVRAFRFIAFFVFLSFHFTTKAQTSIDHWETVIYAAGQWRYLSPESPVAANWRMTGFDDGNWAMGNGGIGYGDDDDATEIAPTNALFLRKEFEIIDVSKLELAILHADFDDGFVAYINGVEIARANVDGLPPAFNAEASDLREAEMYQGGLPVPFTLTKDFVQDHFISGTNTLAIQVHNFNGLNSSDLSAIFFLSLGINDASMDYRPTPSWFIDPSFSSNLPILKINTMGGVIQDDPRIRAHLGVINNGPGQLNNSGDPFNGYDGAISIEIRGASSQLFPKKAYSMETQQADGSNNNVELLGLPKENDWVLNGPYSDKTLLRNVLTYGLVRDMGPYYSPRTRYCELMINEDYRGVYILIEKIKQDKNRVDIDPLEPEDITGDELTGGYIVQIDRETPEGFGWYSNHAPYPFFVYEDPDGDQLAQVQKNYIRNHLNAFENAMINPNYADRYKDFIDPASFIDYFLINELTKDVDAFKLSFFMHKDKDSKGGKLIFGPVWDFNLGYGNFDFCEENPQGWAYNFDIDCGSTLPFWIKRLLQIPELRNQLKCRWESL